MIYRVWTVSNAATNHCREQDIHHVNIHPQSGSKMLAADNDDIFNYLTGKITEEEFVVRYTRKLDQLVTTFPTVMNDLEKYPDIAIACNCRPGAFCQRHILAEWYVRYLNLKGHRTAFMGEIEPF